MLQNIFIKKRFGHTLRFIKNLQNCWLHLIRNRVGELRNIIFCFVHFLNAFFQAIQF